MSKIRLLTQAQGMMASDAFLLSEGQMYNGKIVPSVTSNNLTVALKTQAGTDATPTNPIYVMIGGVVRTITGALSKTVNAGSFSWFNMGSAELATKEVDLFAYLSWNATAVGIGFSRIPYGKIASDFSAGVDTEKYLQSSTTLASTDSVVNIGRFAATLSAGAGYTWSVPTFTPVNLVQRPIYESRWLEWTPTLTWTALVAPSGSPTAIINSYIIRNRTIYIKFERRVYTAGTGVTILKITLPFDSTGFQHPLANGLICTDGNVPNLTSARFNWDSGSTCTINCTSVSAGAVFLDGNYQIL